MKEFEVQVDVTMSGSVYVDAESESEARELVKKRMANITSSDLRSFCCVNKEIVDVWGVE